MRLLEKYALESGLKVGSQFLLDKFYPVPVERYITLHGASGQAAKNYPYYQEVVVMLKAILDTHGIAIVQLGADKEPPVQGCVHLMGKTSLHQSNYVVSRSLLHLGNDSWLAHRAGYLGIPLITLFGSTRASNHGALRFNPEKTAFVEAHRWDKLPSFASQEQPQSISTIPPEKVVNLVCQFLGLPNRITHETRMFGLLYAHALFDVVPNSFPAPGFLPETPVTVRMDYLFREDVLANLLMTGRKVNIMTKKPLDMNLLAQFKDSILSYTHEIDESCPPQYLGMIGGIVRHSSFFTKERDDAKVAALRFKFFDICNIMKVNDVSRDDYLNASLNYLNRENDGKPALEAELAAGTVRFKANKYILSEGKIYLSPAHLKLNKPTDSFANNAATVIDDPDFWRDLNHDYIFNQP